MSLGKSWEVQPGLGAEILSGLGNDVRERRALGPPMPQLLLLAEVYEQSADILREEHMNLVSAVSANTELAALLRRFGGTDERVQMSRYEYTQALIAKAQKIDSREYLGNDHNWRFRIRPLVSEAVGWKVTGGGGNSGEGETLLLPTDEVREGRSGVVGSITSSTEVGGELVIDLPGKERILPRRRGVHITSLVSPQTGDAQVDLEILVKK